MLLVVLENLDTRLEICLIPTVEISESDMDGVRRLAHERK